MLVELHSHLYGCLSLGDLHWLFRRKPPRKEIFTHSYQSLYGDAPDWELLFENSPRGRAYLEECYHFQRLPGRKVSGFAVFQTAFDLVISLSHTDPEELIQVCSRVAASEEADYVEYRMLFSPAEPEAAWKEKVLALCEGLLVASKESNKTLRLALSLWREPALAEKQYGWLRELQFRFDSVQKALVAIDFCAREEGHPPRELSFLFQKIHEDNARNPDLALAVLYHVGESFEDKSVESAARWVVEAARLGCHRLGHALALGLPASFFSGSTRREVRDERIAHLQFLLEHKSELQAFGYPMDARVRESCSKELEFLLEDRNGPPIWVQYDAAAQKALSAFQEFAMQEVKKAGAVIECCPSSNLRIARIQDPALHPLRRFLEAGLPVVIGSDDRGILGSNLSAEYGLVANWPGMSQEDIKEMQGRAQKSRSDLLAGRIRSGTSPV